MSTTVYFRDANSTIRRGTNDADLAGTNRGWASRLLSTSRGASATSTTRATANGPTAGLELGTNLEWVSEPLDADVTISGNISINLRAAESSMSANADIQLVLERLDSTGTVVSTILDSEENAELGTGEAARAWTPTPTSTAMLKGDRIRARVAANDQTTMATGFTITFWYDGPTGGASGDSFITFTETFGFLTATPSGTVIYLTDTASDVSTSAVDREAWTSRGSGVQNDITNTTAGFTAPIQTTDTAGGTVVDWWTKQLQAFTLGDLVVANMRGSSSDGVTSTSGRVEIAVCASDGTSCTTWAAANALAAHSIPENAKTITLAGDDTSVTDGQRLRIRWLIDDGANVEAGATSAMGASKTITTYYAGTSGGASGDTFLTFTQTLAEFSAAERVPYFSIYPQILPQ